MKWVAFGCALFVAGWLLQFFLQPEDAEPPFLLAAVFLGGVVAIPVSMTIGIIRHRLFDIDRIISRTLGYALVVGVLLLVYLGGAVYLPSLVISEQTPPRFRCRIDTRCDCPLQPGPKTDSHLGGSPIQPVAS